MSSGCLLSLQSLRQINIAIQAKDGGTLKTRVETFRCIKHQPYPHMQTRDKKEEKRNPTSTKHKPSTTQRPKWRN